MKKKLVLMCMSMMFLFAGCSEIADVAVTISEDPYGPLFAASIVYQETLDVLIDMRNKEVFNDNEIEKITLVLDRIYDAFGKWDKAIDSGVFEIDYEDFVRESIAILKEFITKGILRSTT